MKVHLALNGSVQGSGPEGNGKVQSERAVEYETSVRMQPIHVCTCRPSISSWTSVGLDGLEGSKNFEVEMQRIISNEWRICPYSLSH